MKTEDLIIILEQLCKEPQENEWLEFKANHCCPDDIGKRISALSNGACLENQQHGYLIFGVENITHKIIGTNYKPRKVKAGNENLEHWLINRLEPGIDFKIYEFPYKEKPIVIFEIPAASKTPTKFQNIAYIRINDATRELSKFPEKERRLWKKLSALIFEREIAMSNVASNEVVSLLDTQSYFELFELPYPSTREGVIEKLLNEKLIAKNHSKYNITNLGAILFAKDLNSFDSLARKAIRIIIYEGKNKLNTLKTYTETKGYALSFKSIVNYILDQIPRNEVIEKAIRKSFTMYPEIAIRELVANAIIHQDFTETGTGVIIEIYSDRIDITNPGKPIITTVRFIDEFQSRNDKLASFMRRIGICEEQGSGIDKVIASVEQFQLPAPDFLVKEKHTKVTLFAHMLFKEMTKKDKVRACYQHCALRYVFNKKMTNQSLRERFSIAKRNSAMATRILNATINGQLIKRENPDSTDLKSITYIPFWA